MRIAYIAHPVSGDINGNLRRIEKIIRKINLEESDVVPFAHYFVDCYALDDDVEKERRRGIRNDKAIMKRGVVDEIRLYGDRISEGMADEVELAHKLGIKVIPMTDQTEEEYFLRWKKIKDGTTSKEPWIMTYTGIKFFPFNPDIDSFVIEDIAHSLANQCRFNGHTKSYYSVAQHSVNVSRICGEHSLCGLLHDGTEAYFSDLPTPIKKRMNNVVNMENNLACTLSRKFGFPFPFPEEVKDADKSMLNIEGMEFMGWEERYYDEVPEIDMYECSVDMYPHTPDTAKKMFLEEYEKITEDSYGL